MRKLILSAGWAVRVGAPAIVTVLLSTYVLFCTVCYYTPEACDRIVDEYQKQGATSVPEGGPSIVRITGAYWMWLGGAVQGNLGAGVLEKLVAGVLRTGRLILGSLAIGLAIALLVGGAAAVREDLLLSRLGLAVVYAFSAMPLFILGYIAYHTYQDAGNVLGAPGHPMPGVVWAWMRVHMLPMVLLALGDGISADLVRTFRAEVQKLLAEPYIRAALARRGSLFRHIGRGVGVALISSVNSRIAYLLGGAIVVEKIFSWKKDGLEREGLGEFLFTALREGDVALLMGIVLFTVIVVQTLDVAHRTAVWMADPRARLREGSQVQEA